MNYAITSTQLINIIDTDSLLIDLRDSYLFNLSHVKNFINIPLYAFIKQKDHLPKNKPIYLICQSGKLAKKEVEDLRLKNYQAFYIEGGMNEMLNSPPPKYY